jgi:8-oxo-dGTP pyrophosphatase MutT (NUDIX family)
MCESVVKYQSAAIPYRVVGSDLEILLVTSNRGRRWVLPKGAVKARTQPHLSAAEEAYEEAGIIGTVSNEPIGIYRQAKRTGEAVASLIMVRAFPLLVTSEMQVWPEMTKRQRRWLPIAEAIEAVGDRELRELIVTFGEFMRGRLGCSPPRS